jgi:hypothetical protein
MCRSFHEMFLGIQTLPGWLIRIMADSVPDLLIFPKF